MTGSRYRMERGFAVKAQMPAGGGGRTLMVPIQKANGNGWTETMMVLPNAITLMQTVGVF